MNIKRYLWIFPFICFFLGYIFVSFIVSSKSIKTPTLLGFDVSAASKILSDANLNLRIIDQKEDPDLPNNLVIQQTPKPGQTIKTNQSVFCIITKHPPVAKTPPLIQKSEQELNKVSSPSIHLNIYKVPSNQSKNICIGQIPKAQEDLTDKMVVAYIADNCNSQVLFPKFVGKTVNEIITWLKPYNFKIETIHRKMHNEKHENCDCIIMDQKPLPGTIIDINKPNHIQLIA